MTIGEGLLSIAIAYIVVHGLYVWANFLVNRRNPSLEDRVKKIEDMLKDML